MEPLQWLTLNFAEVELVEELCVLSVKGGIEGMVDEILYAWLVSAIKFKQSLSNKLVMLSVSVEFIVKIFLR